MYIIKMAMLIITLLLISGCRDEVYNDQAIIEENEEMGQGLEISGYDELSDLIYINENIETDSSNLPYSYDMGDVSAETISENIANHYGITYSLDEVEVDNHSQTQIVFGQSQGHALLNVNQDSSIFMDLNFGDGGALTSLLSSIELELPSEEFAFMSIDEIEEESSKILQQITGISDYNFLTYSITEDELSGLIAENEKIAEELGKPAPPIVSRDLYYVHATPIINNYEILAFEVLGRDEDWTLFNPGSDIKLIFSENGLQNIYINSLYIPGVEIPETNQEPEYSQKDIIDMTVNQFKERLDNKPIMIESIDYIYIPYIPDLDVQQKIYKPFWRVIINESDGRQLDKLYFDPLTGSEYQ